MAAHHQIAFPVADACFLLDDQRTIVNRDPIGYSAFVVGRRKRSTRAQSMTQMGIQRATGHPVGTDMLINTLMRKRKPMMPKEPSTDLLRTPLQPQFALDETTPVARPFIRPAFVVVSLLHLLVSGAGMVAIVAFVTAKFSRDRRGVRPHDFSDALLAMTGFSQRRYSYLCSRANWLYSFISSSTWGW